MICKHTTRTRSSLTLLLLLVVTTCSTISKASHATSAYANDWKPPEVPAQRNDTCYNEDNCEACWKGDCFSQADEIYESCKTLSLPYNETYCQQLGADAYKECGHQCFFCNQDLKACSTSDILETIDLRIEDNQWANEEAPPPWVAFTIGGCFCLVALIHWMFRFLKVHNRLDESNRKRKGVLFRAALVTLGDDDEPLFTILRMMTQGFLLLGGFQINYHLTLIVLLAVYFAISLRDTFRVLVAYNANKKVEDYVVVTNRYKRAVVHPRQGTKSWIELKTKNIYENLSRDFTVVGMVFITQALLISFVVIDVYNSKDRHKSIAGAEDVPVVGTNLSYCMYILGIFMSIVYLVGPKTSFGQSKENPHYWVQLLLIAKLTGATCTWHNPVEGKDKTIPLKPGDKRVWLRFFLSFLINGYGFHVLVHLLPIQVAAESSFTGVVFRAVGMMYLIDLDDTPSVTLSLHEGLDEGKHQGVDQSDDLLEALRRESSVMQSRIQIMQQLRNSLGSMATCTAQQVPLDPIVENAPNNNGVAGQEEFGIQSLASSSCVPADSNEDILQSLRTSSFRTTSTSATPLDTHQQNNLPLPSFRAAARGNILLDLANIEPEVEEESAAADDPAAPEDGLGAQDAQGATSEDAS